MKSKTVHDKERNTGTIPALAHEGEMSKSHKFPTRIEEKLAEIEARAAGRFNYRIVDRDIPALVKALRHTLEAFVSIFGTGSNTFHKLTGEIDQILTGEQP